MSETKQKPQLFLWNIKGIINILFFFLGKAFVLLHMSLCLRAEERALGLCVIVCHAQGCD